MEIVNLIVNLLILATCGVILFFYGTSLLHDWLKKPNLKDTFERISDDMIFLKDLFPNHAWIYFNEKTDKKYKITVNVEEIENGDSNWYT